jgi:hypothetical protein
VDERVGLAATLETSILKVLGSNFSKKIDYLFLFFFCGIPQSL